MYKVLALQEGVFTMLNSLKRLIWQFIPQTITAKFTFFDIFDAFLAAARYGFPGRKLKIIGITGTDGKTTTTYFLYEILKAAGKNVGMINTVEARIDDDSYQTGLHVTTPDPWELNRILDDMVSAKCEYVVLEVTSHAIHQHRILGISFEIAGLTNITHEHLDVHNGSFEAYKRTKLRLLKKAKQAFKAEEIDESIIADVKLNIAGEYNRLNAKLAAAIAQYLDIPRDAIKKGIENLTYVKGRMNIVYDEEFTVIVDFAHTPNALQAVLSSGKKLVRDTGRLIAVFGSAGERDPYKRPIMGKTASSIADIVILTADDPRTERVEDINAAIVKGALEAGAIENETLFLEPDRSAAIQLALLKFARPRDVIIISGKGHEQSMSYPEGERPWNDEKAVKEILTSSSNS